MSSKHVKNGIWLYLLQFFNTIIPLITLPYITRVMGAERYGLFSTALNVIMYFQVVVEYGFGMSATREVTIIKEDPKKISLLFNSVVFSRICLLFISVIAIIIIGLLDDDKEMVLCLAILCSCLVGYCFQQNWLFQGMQEMKYISVINIIARSISTVLIFLLVKSREDIYLYCFLYAVSPLISGLLGMIIAYCRYKLTFFIPKIDEIKQSLKDGWYIFTTQFSAKVLNIVGITFLGWFTTNYDVGIYSAINKIANMVILLWTPISQVLYPISSEKLAKSFDDGMAFILHLRKIIISIFGSGILLGILLSKYLVRIAFGAEYAPYYYLLIPQLIFVLVAINNNFWGCQILLGGGYDKEYSKCFQISVIATVIINLVLIYCFGKNGAMFCSLISELILSVLLYKSIIGIKGEKGIS